MDRHLLEAQPLVDQEPTSLHTVKDADIIERVCESVIASSLSRRVLHFEKVVPLIY